MCGIAGLYARGGRLDVDPAVIDAMCQRIVHRGPDDRGVFRHPLAHIGMQRLSIIDISTGHQPIHNEDRSVWIVFNGEIYNFRELRGELEASGHVFYTHTDTECIVHGYEQWGEGVFDRLRGMFAVAILDLAQDKLVLGRDRLGKKPLYYATLADGTLAFGSELKCLTVVPGFRAEVSPQATHDYFALGYIPAPASIYEGIHKLPPAHVLVAQGGKTHLHRYWQPVFGPKWTDDEATLQHRLLEQLEEAVRVRLVSDVPFGAFLSGGLDSSVVAALMARNLAQPVKTFSIGFREERFNELPAARAVARHIGADHTELVVEADAVSTLKDLVWYFDEPFGDSSSVPTHLVSRLAASHVKMVLSGDGGDELFAGYDKYASFMAAPALRDLPATDFARHYVEHTGLFGTQARAALLNPAVDPARDLRGQIGTLTAWHDPALQFDFTAQHVDELHALEVGDLRAPVPDPQRYLVIIAQGDEVLDWREMSGHYTGAAIKLLPGGDHALSDFEQHLEDLLDFLDMA
ncbi:asparagine synthetase 1 [mine drainage metagenome]|uniref:Asparagine synthetase 1 n=1 Tax=mine drainage metagenome TaxID=410659 RepID=A0A1J5QFK9_9ZZZZ